MDVGWTGRRRNPGLPLADFGSRRTTRAKAQPKNLPPLHPGEVLREEFLVPLGLSPGALAKAMGVPRTRVERIAAESTGITADTALRLSKALGTSAQLWLNLQNSYAVKTTQRAIRKPITKINPVPAAPPP